MLKIGLIGIGHVSQLQLEAASISNAVQFVGAFDKVPEKAKQLPSDVPFYGTLAELLNHSQADVFVVSTPNVNHYETALAVIQAGRALCIEKPMCVSLAEFEELKHAISRAGIFASVAFHAAHANDLRWWLEAQSSQATGALRGFQCGFFDPYIQEEQLSPSAAILGGALIDSGINALSVVGQVIEPEALRVRSSLITSLPSYSCDQIASSTVVEWLSSSETYGGSGIIETSWAVNLNRKITLLDYERLRVLLHHSNECVYVKSYDEAHWRLVQDLRNHNTRLVNHYINLFQDLAVRFNSSRSNLMDFAEPLHRLLFSAINANVPEYFNDPQ